MNMKTNPTTPDDLGTVITAGRSKLETFDGIDSPCTVREAVGIYQGRVRELEDERLLWLQRAVDAQAESNERGRRLLAMLKSTGSRPASPTDYATARDAAENDEEIT